MATSSSLLFTMGSLPGGSGHQMLELHKTWGGWGGSVAMCGIEFTLFTALQDIISFFQCNTSWSHNQVLPLCHGLEEKNHIFNVKIINLYKYLILRQIFIKKYSHLLQRFVMVFLRQEIDISGGDDANQLAAHFARLCDRNTWEAMSYFGFKHIPDCVAWTHHHWVCDKTLLKPLKRKKTKKQPSLPVSSLY